VIRTLTPELRRHIISARDLNASENNQRILSNVYDACVIGSGPGGAVAAATLAERGLKVLLVEKGPFIPQEQINFRVLDMSNKFGHVETTSGYRTVLYQGSAVGGSSMIFGAVAMKPKQFIFDEWREKSGTTEINAETLEPHYEHVAKTMSVTPSCGKWLRHSASQTISCWLIDTRAAALEWGFATSGVVST
jgi:choline dehydrogenase-like flavoprotein